MDTRTHTVARSGSLEKARLVADQLVAMGLEIISVRLGVVPCINVRASDACKQLSSFYSGQGFDGNERFYRYRATVDGIHVEWKKPRSLLFRGAR